MGKAVLAVETATGRKCELEPATDGYRVRDDDIHVTPTGYSFMAFLRQNGFPSPLLDWSRSPYVAAFFAFSGAKPKEGEAVAVFEYVDSVDGGRSAQSPQASIHPLGPWIGTDRKHFLQQSEYTVCRKDGPGGGLVRWDKDQKKSVQIGEPFAKIYAGDQGFLGELGRLGHGLQRSYMFALLHELSGSDVTDAPRLLLGIEEPELFQHPPQAQHLSDVLTKLSTGNAQVFACTHSPYFVSGKGFEDVRLVRKPAQGAVTVSELSFAALSAHLAATLGETKYRRPEGVRAKINQSLQPAMREMFFAPKIILVEGLEDVAYITAGLHLFGLWEKWRSGGGHLVPVHGKSELVQPLAIAQLLKIPSFVMFDADGDETRENPRNLHKADNERLLKLLGKDPSGAFPTAAVFEPSHIIWPKNLGASIRADFTPEDWAKWKTATEAELGSIGGLEKNSMFIASVLEQAWDEQKPSPTLKAVCDQVMGFVAL